MFGHWDVVTSLAYDLDTIGNNSNDAVVVSGSRDATLLVWNWNGKQQRMSSNGKPGIYFSFYKIVFCMIAMMVIPFKLS